MRFPTLVLVALVLPALTGCAEDIEPTAIVEPDVLLVTEENAEEALTNESFQLQAHLHDYWGGAERLVVMDESKDDQTLFVSENWQVALVPPDGKFVPQGTSRVEVTVAWVDGSGTSYGRPELWVRTAADAEAVLIGPVANGATLTVPTTLANADLPHQSLSRWVFEWRIHPGDVPPNFIRWEGTVSMRVEAVRGLEIPIYPPHPDLWGGADTLSLLDDGQGLGVWEGDVDDYNCYGACPQIHRPADGAMVPFDAEAVEVTLTEGDASATRVGLKYHAADARAWIDLVPTQTSGAERTYVIPVTPLMADSPYATQSQWEFAPYTSEPERDSLHAGAYTVSARVLRAV